MSQADIIKVLEKNNDRWLDSGEIAEQIGLNRNNINKNLLSLHKFGEVKKRSGISEKGRRIYKYKIQ